MEKTIVINDQEIKLKSNGATPLLYKKHFGKDFFAELTKMQGGKGKEAEGLDLEVFYNFAWLFAKQADKNIPEQLEWLESFDAFPIVEVIEEIQEMITSTIQTSKKKITNNNSSGDEITTEFYFAMAKMCKLDSGDLENMNVGMVIDHIEAYLELKNPSKKSEKVITTAEEIPWL